MRDKTSPPFFLIKKTAKERPFKVTAPSPIPLFSVLFPPEHVLATINHIFNGEASFQPQKKQVCGWNENVGLIIA